MYAASEPADFGGVWVGGKLGLGEY
jgi:hypothetical protein